MAIMSMTSYVMYEKFGAKPLAIIGMLIVIITTAYFLLRSDG